MSQVNYANMDEPLHAQGQPQPDAAAAKKRRTRMLVGVAVLLAAAAAVTVAVLASRKGGKQTLEERILSMVDHDADPCDDFYRFACGSWLDRTELGDKQEIVVSFTEIGEEVQKQIREVSSMRYPMVDNYEEVCGRLDQTSLASLKGTFDKIDAKLGDDATVEDFLKLSGKLQREGLAYGALFSWQVMQNVDNMRTNEMFLTQDGLSFAGDAQIFGGSFPTQNYTSAVGAVFDLLEKAGLIDSSSDSFARVEATEMTLFQQLSPVNLNDPDEFNQTYIMEVSKFKDETNLDVGLFLSELSPHREISNISVSGLEQWRNIATVVSDNTQFTPAVMRDYLKYRVVYSVMNYVGEEMMEVAAFMRAKLHNDSPYPWVGLPLRVDEPDQYYGLNARVPEALKTPTMRGHRGRGYDEAGMAERRERLAREWALDREVQQGRGLASLTQGQITAYRKQLCKLSATALFDTWYMHQYLLKDFPSYDEKLADRLVNDTITHLRERLSTVSWLDNTTRAAAQEKLNHLVPNVATDPFEGTAGLEIDTTWTPLEAFQNTVSWRFNRSVHKAMTPYDRKAYQGPAEEMPPWAQNAFYQPTSNTINLLPGLMLPPMFDPDMPYMLNVAAYVMVIGHECTHGYDNSGRLFGPYGAYKNWWQPESIAEFDKRTQCLVDQYSSFSQGGVHVNGSQTLGENIADGGGVDMAWSVYKSISPAPQEGFVKGFSNDELHFLYYAQTWCTKATQEAYEYQVFNDVHSPDQFRIRGPLSNFKPFAETFKCKANQGYYSRGLDESKACVVW